MTVQLEVSDTKYCLQGTVQWNRRTCGRIASSQARHSIQLQPSLVSRAHSTTGIFSVVLDMVLHNWRIASKHHTREQGVITNRKEKQPEADSVRYELLRSCQNLEVNIYVKQIAAVLSEPPCLIYAGVQ